MDALSDDLAVVIRETYGKVLEPSTTSISLEECRFVAALISEYKPERTLEVGFAHGGSAAAIIAAKRFCGIDVPHIAIDPYQRSHSSSFGLKTLERVRFLSDFELIEELSEVALPKLLGEARRFDFILIDGGHGLGQAMVDVYFADRLLECGGVICIDDCFMKSTARSLEFLLDECGYEMIRGGARSPSPLRVAVRTSRLSVSLAYRLSRAAVDGMCAVRKRRTYMGGY